MNPEAVSLSSQLSESLKKALDLPNGARFYRCALQVNPFAYLVRHDKAMNFKSGDEYNDAIVRTCQEIGIEVIAVTDHYRVKQSLGLVRAARTAGLFAFGEFEAVTKDGVHFLCLFNPDKDENLELYIGDCGIHDTEQPSPTGQLDAIEPMESSKN
ncbi:MAG: hypothetical protein OXI87_16430 [Albidovulum sp.]|nr:hypothetical protein [Albidovulum sp.]MDE0306443.1 hypothetical protein [Albidovulum sp.]MDE0531160.1 hypothetical protein [Albidovulum sp.]